MKLIFYNGETVGKVNNSEEKLQNLKKFRKNVQKR